MKIARSWVIATLAATSYDVVANAELFVIEHAFGAMSEVSLGQHKFLCILCTISLPAMNPMAYLWINRSEARYAEDVLAASLMSGTPLI